MRYFVLFSLSIVTLAACVTASPKVEEGELSALRDENKGIVLIHTSLNDVDPTHVAVTLARPDESGRYAVYRNAVPIKFSLDSSKLPGQLKLPAGQYGIVELHALDKSQNRRFSAPDMKLEGPTLKKVYDHPIVTFTVGPGEVVDVGSLRVIEGRRETALFGQTGAFAVNVTPTPEPLLRNLAEYNPHLFNARVVRQMVVVAQRQKSS